MLCVIQARASSIRLKRKIFQLIDNKTILEHVINNVKSCNNIKKIIIATSKNEDDNETKNLCDKLNTEVYRGSLKNVASRFYEIINKYKSDKFIRLNADSPLIDSKLIDEFISYSNSKINDITTNALHRSFPKGQSIEIFNTDFFKQEYKNISTDDHKEHVTKYFYENKNNYKILNIKNSTPYSEINLSVDTEEDLQRIKNIYNLSKNKNWLSYAKIYKEIYK